MPPTAPANDTVTPAPHTSDPTATLSLHDALPIFAVDSTDPTDSPTTDAGPTSDVDSTVTPVIYVDARPHAAAPITPATTTPDTSGPTASPDSTTPPAPIAVDSTDPTDSPTTDADP